MKRKSIEARIGQLVRELERSKTLDFDSDQKRSYLDLQGALKTAKGAACLHAQNLATSECVTCRGRGYTPDAPCSECGHSTAGYCSECKGEGRVKRRS